MESDFEAVRVCKNGHIKDRGIPYERAEFIGVETTIDTGSNYCGSCGSEIIWYCERCESSILIESYSRAVEKEDLPNHCRECGTDYPWADTIARDGRDGLFLDVDDTTINGQFYPPLIYEVNQCYQMKADEAALVLTRKLVENLLIDILRGHFGIEENHIYYNQDLGQHRGFKELIEKLKENYSELDQYSTVEKDDLIDKLNQLKYRGDASAHSIEHTVSEDQLEMLSSDATYVVKVLLRIRREVHTAHRD